jgi:hypothetical protein
VNDRFVLRIQPVDATGNGCRTMIFVCLLWSS